MNSIRIDYEGVSPEHAMDTVSTVVAMGRISVGNGINHYCWATRFIDGTVVGTRHKRKPDAADSFFVYREDQ